MIVLKEYSKDDKRLRNVDPVIDALNKHLDQEDADYEYVAAVLKRMAWKMENFPRNSHIGLSKNWGPRVKVKTEEAPKIMLEPENSPDDLHYVYSQAVMIDGQRVGVVNYELISDVNGSEDTRDWFEWHCTYVSDELGTFPGIAFFWTNDFHGNERAVAWNRMPIILALECLVRNLEPVMPKMMSNEEFSTYVVKKLPGFAKKYAPEIVDRVEEIAQPWSEVGVDDEQEVASHRRNNDDEDEDSVWNESFDELLQFDPAKLL